MAEEFNIMACVGLCNLFLCVKMPHVVLDKESVEIGDITFVCATMWTSMNNEDPVTLHAVKYMMNDFRNVKNSHNMVSRKVPLYDNNNFETNKEGYVVRNVIGHKFKEEPSKFTLNKLSSYNLNVNLDITDFINTYYQEPPFYIFVHFPNESPFLELTLAIGN